MKTEPLKNLIACLATAAHEWNMTRWCYPPFDSPQAAADILAVAVTDATDDDLTLQPAEIAARASDITPLRVLAACRQYHILVCDLMNTEPDLAIELQIEAIYRLPGFEPWPEE